MEKKWNKWSGKEIEKLRYLYKTKFAREIAILLDRSYSSVISKINKLKLKGKNEFKNKRIKFAPWNKGLKGIDYKRYYENGMKGLFVKGMISWNKNLKGEEYLNHYPNGFKFPAYSGIKHWNWKGGQSYGFGSSEWIKILEEIRRRDNHTCQKCGKKNDIGKKEFDVHHIIPYDISKNNDFSNLKTLCKSCHRKTHIELNQMRGYNG